MAAGSNVAEGPKRACSQAVWLDEGLSFEDNCEI